MSLFGIAVSPIVRWLIAGLVLLAAAGAGFVAGDDHASARAEKTIADSVQAQANADAKVAKAQFAQYEARMKAAGQERDLLAAALSQARARLSAQQTADNERLNHAIPDNRVCDLSPAALDVLRNNPARLPLAADSAAGTHPVPAKP